MSARPRWMSSMGLTILAIFASLTASTGVSRAPGQSNDQAAQELPEGKKLFQARCGICHLAGGTGTFMLARRLGKDRALLESRTDLSAAYIRKISRVGIGSMPPLNRIELPDRELDLIASYLTRPASARRESGANAQKPAGGGVHE